VPTVAAAVTVATPDMPSAELALEAVLDCAKTLLKPAKAANQEVSLSMMSSTHDRAGYSQIELKEECSIEGER